MEDNVIKISILPKALYRFSAIPITVPKIYFTDIEETFQNLYGALNDPEPSAILRKKNKVGGITILDVKLHYKATVMKIVLYWCKNRHT